jgi:hypothetical protein
MEKDKYSIIAAMKQYGGSFVRDLATLWITADPENRQRIEAAWPEFFEQYEKLAD